MNSTAKIVIKTLLSFLLFFIAIQSTHFDRQETLTLIYDNIDQEVIAQTNQTLHEVCKQEIQIESSLIAREVSDEIVIESSHCKEGLPNLDRESVTDQLDHFLQEGSLSIVWNQFSFFLSLNFHFILITIIIFYAVISRIESKAEKYQFTRDVFVTIGGVLLVISAVVIILFFYVPYDMTLLFEQVYTLNPDEVVVFTPKDLLNLVVIPIVNTLFDLRTLSVGVLYLCIGYYFNQLNKNEQETQE